ncbi:FtsW/RodA/SpoVE family cell cycle protein [Acutalibacter caecimuris]|uniref:FtsW/RodA/SpoVE family cell cycle protein n=1 Tax=Acutalibacter caecimuris TaxID=3093657 RepID=UPI002AC89C61|nr:FtsW/RodA/SpoVE family cell cycle protein [Acutalibacter sp. M00118]
MLNQLFKSLFSYLKRADLILWFLLAAMSTYSLVLLKSVSRATPVDYFRAQLFPIALGIIGAVIISLMDYAEISNFWYLIEGFCIFLMIYTYFFGERIQGTGGVDARAWIQIGGRTFQTSELVKIAFMLTYAKHLDVLKKRGKLNDILQVVLLGLHALLYMVLCQRQGDLGAAIVFFFMFIFMSLSAGVHLRYFATLVGLLVIALPIAWRYLMEDYQKDRFVAVFNLDTDPDVRMFSGYQQWQGRISIGSGRFKGQGLFQGPRVASNVVTFQQSDCIFTVAGEELGFVGCSLLLLLLLLFMLKVLHVATSSRDELGRYMCFGFFGLIALQAIWNIGMCLTILPVMGITLPFFSAGGSSSMCLYLGFGLVQSVHMRRKEIDGLHLSRKSPLRFSYKQMKQARELKKL